MLPARANQKEHQRTNTCHVAAVVVCSTKVANAVKTEGKGNIC